MTMNTMSKEKYSYAGDEEVVTVSRRMFEEYKRVYDQVMNVRKEALEAFMEMRNIAAIHGYMTDEEIEAEIQASRHERHSRKRS